MQDMTLLFNASSLEVLEILHKPARSRRPDYRISFPARQQRSLGHPFVDRRAQDTSASPDPVTLRAGSVLSSTLQLHRHRDSKISLRFRDKNAPPQNLDIASLAAAAAMPPRQSCRGHKARAH